MNFEIGKCYKHKNMVDVAFRIEDILGTTAFKVSWINTLYNMPMGVTEAIEIKLEDQPKYQEYKVVYA